MKKRGAGIPSRFILTFLAIFCVVLLFLNYAVGFSGGPLKTVANYLFVPMQEGVNFIGSRIAVNSEAVRTRQELQEENQELKTQVEELTNQLTNMRMQQTELSELQELYALDQQYSQYQTTGAHVIAKGNSNWFNTFTIDKGENDGIKEDMNVIAGNGLVGIVTETGKDYSTVRTIIDDTSSVSGMVLETSDNLIVSGDLTTMTEDNMILFSHLEDSTGGIKAGDAVVTSNISDKYLSGILIGYVSTVTDDANHLTKSGKLTPVVDFKHLQYVLIITTTKETELN